MEKANFRCIVNDVPRAILFYERLGFSIAMHPDPGFAMLESNNLRLLLNQPGSGGAGQSMADGTRPHPGGWNRIQLQFKNLSDTVRRFKQDGVNFRNDITQGKGGLQVLIEDPSGNPVELFEPSDQRSR